MSEQEQYDEWKALPLSEKMRSDIAMASCYADEVAQLEQELVAVLKVSIARGEQLGYDDGDYEKRIVSLLTAESP